MTTIILGNICRFVTEPNEISKNPLTITLPDGYSLETICITNCINILWFNSAVSITNNRIYTFPAIDSKSPCVLKLSITDLTNLPILCL